jgi:hypothetical protein
MSQVTRTNGGSYPVFSIDTKNGAMSGTLTAPALVQAAGPALDFFAVDLGATLVDEMGVGRAVELALRTIALKTTLHFYQVEVGNQLSVAVYPAGGWTAPELETAIKALGEVEVVAAVEDNANTEEDEEAEAITFDFAATTVTNKGFKLAKV